jgi:hypothetical protein
MLATLYNALHVGEKPIHSTVIQLLLGFVLYTLPASILLNDLFFTDGINTKSAKTLFVSLTYSAGFAPVAAVSLLIIIPLWVWIINDLEISCDGGKKLLVLMLPAIWYLLGVHWVSFYIIERWPTPSSVGLSVVQMGLLAILARRLRSPLTPDLRDDESRKFYAKKQRHLDRLLMTLGVGLIATVLLTISPGGSGVRARATTVILLTPISALLLGNIGIGVARTKSMGTEFIEDRSADNSPEEGKH